MSADTDAQDHVFRHEGYWWHNDHPLDPEQDCCDAALERLLKPNPERGLKVWDGLGARPNG